MKASVVANITKEGVRSLVPRLVELLRRESIDVVLEEKLRPVIGNEYAFADDGGLFDGSDIIVTFGGDGTILHTARRSVGTNAPILGINLGKVGFLAEISPEEIDIVPSKIKAGEFEILDRMAFDVATGDNSYFALNDVVIDRNADTRILTLTVTVDDDFAGEISADGLILSTPTGSTAHSMSAGGPLVMPDCDVFALTLICPHSLANRPMIINSARTIKIGVVAGCARMAVDGQNFVEIQAGSEVLIKQHEVPVKIARFRDKTYFDILHTRLRWGVSLKLKNA